MTPETLGNLPVALKELPVSEWAAAVVIRHATRTFTGRAVDSELLEQLDLFSSGLPGRETARVVVTREVPNDLFTGFLGGYGRVMGAPSALVMIGNDTDARVQESLGYLGEAVMLQATALGLDTCWIAGFFDRKRAGTIADLSPGERIFAVSPLGHAQPRPRAGERFLKRVVGAHKRRPVEEIAPGFDDAHWPAWAAEGVRLARVAPSAANRQPWSFRLITETDPQIRPPVAIGVAISVVERGSEGNISRRLDCGISMLHFEIGARLMGASGTWEILAAPHVARYLVVP